MNSSHVLFLSGFLGREILSRLSKTRLRPFIICRSPSSLRNKDGDYSKFSDIFQIWEISSHKFSSNIFPGFSGLSAAFTAGWPKDFFHGECIPGFPIYHAHPSLLPMYKGYGAVSEQFLRGVRFSGLSVYEENGIYDGGGIVFRENIPINLEDTPKTFLENCADACVRFIEKLSAGCSFKPSPQNPERGFYVPRVRNAQKIIDFNASAYAVYNFIRAYSFPYKGAGFYFKNCRFEAISASIEGWSGFEGEPGRILKVSQDGLLVACGEGCVLIKEISFEESKIDINKINTEMGDLLNGI